MSMRFGNAKWKTGFLTIGEDKLKMSLLPETITKSDGFILSRPDLWN
jgi:hypothetical protein